PSVHHGQIKIHDDDIGLLRKRRCAPRFTVLRYQHFEAFQFKSKLEHVDVVFVVFDIQNAHHEAISGTFWSSLDLTATWRTCSTRVVGLNVSFCRTNSIPELSRA